MQKLVQASENANPSNISSLRIAGFGACMIGGYPHESGGLLEVACALVEKNLSVPVKSHIFTLGGFPAPRAEKYLKRRIFSFDPNYLIIQFGSTDASCPLRAKTRATGSIPQLGASPSAAAIRLPSARSILRWEIQSIIARFYRPSAITSLPSYVAAIEHMVDDCISVHITPIVLSPFIYGSRYSTENAVNYTSALRQLFLGMNQVLFIDCVELLSHFPKSKLLLNDGFHLSRFGHDLIGEAIGRAIIENINAKNLGGTELTAEPAASCFQPHFVN